MLSSSSSRVHIRVDSPARLDIHLSELEAFPFGQRMHYFRTALVHVLDRECNGPFDTVQVVVDAGPGEHDHRRRHAQQRQLG